MKKIIFLVIILIVFMLECVHTATNTAKRTDTFTNIDGNDYSYTVVEVDGDNYIQINDLATILNGKTNGFNLSVDKDVYSITKNTAYTGEEASDINSNIERPFYKKVNISVSVDGESIKTVGAVDIENCRFFRLEDLLDAMETKYRWDEDDSTYCFLNLDEQIEAYAVVLPTEQAKPIVHKKIYESKIIPSKPMIAITFDDGPKQGNTDRIVEALKKSDSRATFFVVGEMVSRHPELVKLAYDAGCQIGNHTYAHLNLVELSADDVKTQIYKTSNLVYDITGEYTMVGRPPYGSINDNVRNCISIPWFNWSIDTLDWKNRDADYIKKYVLDNVKDGSVILMHDLHSTTADAMVSCIPELVNKGYQLVTMDELVKYKYNGDASKVPGYVK